MLPAEKTHYRKGLALGLTMAETFSIIVFILLLACAVLLIGANDAKEVAEDNLKEERVDHAFTRHMLESAAPSGINTDVWLRESRRLSEELSYTETRIEVLVADSVRRRAEIEKLQQMFTSNNRPAELEKELAEQVGHVEALKDSLTQASDAIEELERQQESLETRLQEAREVSEAAREAISRHEGLDSTEATEELRKAAEEIRQTDRVDRLVDSLEVARDVIATLETGQAMWDSLANASDTDPDALRATAARERMRASSMQDRLAAREREQNEAIDNLVVANRERDEAISRAEYREEEVRQLRGGQGIDPPPCWLDSENDPEHIFRAVLTDAGIRLDDITPPHRRDDPAMVHLAAIESGRTYTTGEFFELTRPIYHESLSRRSFGAMGCRFWVRPVDETGARKDIFRQRERQLGRHFWFRW